mmetsp:Transcript_13438/g.34248  ORF Transcript_13438/g.34248 Transcript_13438/m.34248 type:complete len:239 (-) Transcript_13438:1102-1818(-)
MVAHQRRKLFALDGVIEGVSVDVPIPQQREPPHEASDESPSGLEKDVCAQRAAPGHSEERQAPVRQKQHDGYHGDNVVQLPTTSGVKSRVIQGSQIGHGASARAHTRMQSIGSGARECMVHLEKKDAPEVGPTLKGRPRGECLELCGYCIATLGVYAEHIRWVGVMTYRKSEHGDKPDEGKDARDPHDELVRLCKLEPGKASIGAAGSTRGMPCSGCVEALKNGGNEPARNSAESSAS